MYSKSRYLVMRQGGFAAALVVVVAALVGVLGWLLYKNNFNAPKKILPTSPATTSSYTPITEEPVNTTAWPVVSPIKGYSFKCPPEWECYKIDNQINDYNEIPSDVVINAPASYRSNHYINSFGLVLITPQLFQKSMIKNPNYSTPIDWYSDLVIKNKKSIEVLPSTIFKVPGTDGVVYPVYHNFDFNKMTVFQTGGGIKGLMFHPSSTSVPGTEIFIPLNNNLLHIHFEPDSLVDDPIVMSILTSIRPD